MRIEELVKEYPKLYHMAEDGSWANIQKHGLLSTSALLDKWEYSGAERERIESQHRAKKEPIYHPEYGKAVIRDQKVMPHTDLEQCLLEGMKPSDWFKFINRKTFFWATCQRLEWFLGAREYVNKPHLVITVDTRGLAERHAEQITLTDQNTGSTLFDRSRYPRPRLRGKGTFKKIEDYPYSAVDRIVELAVEYSVPDIVDVTLSVARWIAHREGFGELECQNLEDIWP